MRLNHAYFLTNLLKEKTAYSIMKYVLSALKLILHMLCP